MNNGYNVLAEAIIMPRIERYKELVVLYKESNDEKYKDEMKELDEYFRSDSFRALSGFSERTVEAMIDGLRTGGKYFKFRWDKQLYHGKKYR